MKQIATRDVPTRVETVCLSLSSVQFELLVAGVSTASPHRAASLGSLGVVDAWHVVNVHARLFICLVFSELVLQLFIGVSGVVWEHGPIRVGVADRGTDS